MHCTPQTIAEVIANLRSRRPLIHHITNTVTVNGVANITLCAGALPVMAHAREEVEQMVEAASALVLNIGTLSTEQVDAMVLAGRRANQRGIPVVLDPVGVGATELRTVSARRLMQELSIAIIRGNAAEIAVLAGMEATISGVESIGVAADPATIARSLARQQGCVAVITGPVDVVTDGNRLVRVANGHARMGTVTGTGCMATAVIGSCVAVESDRLLAASAALSAYGVAGERAAALSRGPGTFQVQLFDALAGLTTEALIAGVRVTEDADAPRS